MPILQIKNSTPNVGIRNIAPFVRASSFQTANSNKILAGTPIGLLLALTYAETISEPNYGDSRPNIRITNI